MCAVGNHPAMAMNSGAAVWITSASTRERRKPETRTWLPGDDRAWQSVVLMQQDRVMRACRVQRWNQAGQTERRDDTSVGMDVSCIGRESAVRGSAEHIHTRCRDEIGQ